MYYKTDWAAAQKRLEAFWAGEIIDRCPVAVFAPRKTSTLPPFPELQWGPWLGGLDALPDSDGAAIRHWWTDPEQNYKRLTTWFENTYFGGEAIPATYVNWGAMPLAAFYGSTPDFRKTSVWCPAVIRDWGEWEWRFDRAYWRQILDINAYLIERCGGRYFIGYPEIGNAGDVLSLMRGMDNLCVDLLEQPEAVRRGIDVLTTAWIELHEELYLMAREPNGGAGVLAWMGLWAPGRNAQVACDFSSVISPRAFREFFGPEVDRESAWCEYCTYHLDGPQAMKAHLPAIDAHGGIDMIQFTPGSGCPPALSPQYIPRYKQIQAAGKRLYLLVEPEEIEPLLAELSPKGLFLSTQADSEAEADALLANVAKWCAARNVFPVS